MRHTTPDHLMPLTFRRTARLGRARVNVSKSGLMVSRRVGW